MQSYWTNLEARVPIRGSSDYDSLGTRVGIEEDNEETYQIIQVYAYHSKGGILPLPLYTSRVSESADLEEVAQAKLEKATKSTFKLIVTIVNSKRAYRHLEDFL